MRPDPHDPQHRHEARERLLQRALASLSASPRWCLAALVAGAVWWAPVSPAQAQPASPAPQIRQVWYGGALNVIEITNPAEEPSELDDLYLASVPEFWRVVQGQPPQGADEGDFLVRFPEGATLAPGASVFVLVEGEPDDFEARFGFAPDYATSDTQPAERRMRSDGGRVPAASPEPSRGLVALFYWDGVSDRVQDVDLVFWGDDGPRVSRTGVAVDGIDEDDAPTPYADDTPLVEQRPAPAPALDEALVRRGPEGVQAEGGNGIDGEDETSEDLGAEFASAPPDIRRIVPTIQATGRVFSGARSPSVAGITLRFEPDDVSIADVEVITDADGGFEAALPAATEFTVRISGDGILPIESTLTTTGDDLANLNWTLDGVYRVAGQVVGTASVASVAGLTVTLTADPAGDPIAPVVLGADGRFDFALQAPGAYTIRVDGEGVGAQAREVVLSEANVTDLRLQVGAAYDLSGRITQSSDAAPLEGASVALVEAGLSTTADADGVFALIDVAPGVYTLRVQAEGFVTLTQTVTIRGDQTLDVALDPATFYAFDALLQTSDGGAAEGARVTLAPSSGPERFEAVSDANGVAAFEALPPGNYSLQVQLNNYVPLSIRTLPITRDTSATLLLVPVTRLPDTTTDTTLSCATAKTRHAPLSGGGPLALHPMLVLVTLGAASFARRSRRRAQEGR